MEGSKIIEPAFIAKLFNAHAAFDKQSAGMAHSYLDQELGISFSCSRFKITAEGIRTDIGH